MWSADPVGAGACPDPLSWRRDRFDVAFERERQLEGFPLPLRSTGRARLEHETLWWLVEEPIAMTLRIDETGLWQSIGDRAATALPAAAGGAAALLLKALLEGDLAAMAADFVIEKTPDPVTGEWQVSLEPRAPRLAALIRTVQLGGCSRLRFVTVQQPNGDRDRVVFSEPE